MSTLQLEIVTPDKTVVSTETDMVVCPGVMGEFGVLPHHVSLLSALKIGPLRYSDNGRDQYIFISGGFADPYSDGFFWRSRGSTSCCCCSSVFPSG